MTSRIKLHCDYVSSSHVHCNRYTELKVDSLDETVKSAIEDSDWSVDGNKVFCHEHPD